MFDVNKILDALQNDPNTQRTAMAGGGGFAAGLATSMLMGGKGRKMMGKAAKYGAVAALGGLAYHAWQNRSKAGAPEAGAQAAQGSVPVVEDQPTDYAAAPASSAMIAAAKSDGKIDSDEKDAIFKRLNAMDLDGEAKAFVFDELSAPLDINAVIEPAKTPEIAAEIYAASLVAIEADTPAERAYLQMLAARLELDPGLVEEIHRTADAEPA